MIARFVFVSALVALLVTLFVTSTSPRHVSAQELLPTPVGQLGGRMPLPTAPAPLGGSLLQDTPEPSHHPLVGTWLLDFTEGDRTPAEVVFGDDGFVSFTDDAGNRGAGVWIPRGEQGGVLAVSVRAEDTSDQPRPITILHSQIDVSNSGDDATLRYTVETVDGSGAALERSGPFTAVGQRMRGEP
jgi:hypothetical protein